MAAPAPRVEYLAGFRCPLGGPAAGRSRVLCRGAHVLLSAGGELVHVYDRGARRLAAVFRFPAQVGHLQLRARGAALLALCAGKGAFCLALGPAARPASPDGEPPAAVAVEPDACVLPDATLCALAALDPWLVALARGPAQWTLRLFRCPRPGEALRPGDQLGEVALCPRVPPAGLPGQPPAPQAPPPLLRCAVPPGCGARSGPPPGGGGGGGSGAFELEEALFGLLFGADAAVLQSPVALCGLPHGRLCCVPLKALGPARPGPGLPGALVKTLHHLGEPVVFVGGLRTEPPAGDAGDAPADCLVAVGRDGRLLAVRAGRDEAGRPAPELQEHRLPGPVLAVASGGGGRLYLSTPSELHVLDLAAPGAPARAPALPPALSPASLRLRGLLGLCVSAATPEGGAELLALSAKGRLLACFLGPGPTRVAGAQRKMAALLAGIGAVSERASSLRKALEQRGRALADLNAALSASCDLLAGAGLSCSVSAGWSRLPPRDVLTATCLLEARAGLGRGWSLCVAVRPAAGPPAACTLALGPLGPGGRRELTLPLGPDADSCPALPLTVSCTLFCGLRELAGGAEAPQGVPPSPAGVCLALGEHTLDLLQCLRFPGLAGRPPSPPGPPADPLDAFLGTCGPPAPPRAWPPPEASVRVSAELLGGALGDTGPGAPLCHAALCWLLAGNAHLDAVRARVLSSVQGVAPDGADVHLSVREETEPDLCPAGPVRVVDVRMQSPSLAHVSGAHHAVVRRLQTLVVEQAARGARPPDLCLQRMQRMQAEHERLLREVRTLRERLSVDAQAQAAAERLLQVQRQLCSPSLLFL